MTQVNAWTRQGQMPRPVPSGQMGQLAPMTRMYMAMPQLQLPIPVTGNLRPLDAILDGEEVSG